MKITSLMSVILVTTVSILVQAKPIVVPPPLPPSYLIPPTNTVKRTVIAAAANTKTVSVKQDGTSPEPDIPSPVPDIPAPAYVFPAIGTLQKVSDSAAKSVNRIFLFGWAYSTMAHSFRLAAYPICLRIIHSPIKSGWINSLLHR